MPTSPFTQILDDLTKIIDVDDNRGRSVPVNMNFVEESFLSTDTGCEFVGETNDDKPLHSTFEYKKKDGTKYDISAFGFYLRKLVDGEYEIIHRNTKDVAVNVQNSIFTSTGHGLAKNDIVYFTVDDSGELPAGLELNVGYYVRSDKTDDTFTLSATKNEDDEDEDKVVVTSAGSDFDLHQGWATDGEFGWLIYDDELWGGNAVDSFFKWDGETFTEYPDVPRGNSFAVFEDRFCISGVKDNPGSLYPSNIGQPQSHADDAVINPLGTDNITFLAAYFDSLLIFKERSIYKLSYVFDQTVEDFIPKLELQSGSHGACSRKAVVWVENDLWFFTGREVRSIGYQDQQIGILGVNKSVISDRIKATLEYIDRNNYDKIVTYYHDRRFYLSIPLGNDYVDTVFVCHTLHGNSFTKYVNRIKANASDFVLIDNVIHSTTSKAPYGLLKWDEDLKMDDGAKYVSEVKFNRFEEKDFNRFNLYRHVDLQFKDIISVLDVEVICDRNDNRFTVFKSFVVGTDKIDQSVLFGAIPFGELLWGNGYGYDKEFSPFQKKKVSMLRKCQSMTLIVRQDSDKGSFTLVSVGLSGKRMPKRLFKLDNIISV